MAGGFYARWVPPSETQSKPKESSPAPSSVATPQRPRVSEEPPSEKKSKKSKRKSGAQSPEPEPTVLEEDTSVAFDTPEPTKSKKRKRQSIAAETTEQDAEDAPRKAHKAVLSKFERVAKRAEVLKSTVEEAGEKEEEVAQGEEELHGMSSFNEHLRALY